MALTHEAAVKWMRFSLLVFVFMQVHTRYSLYWTCFIYSTVAMSTVGFIVGMVICTLSFEIDFFANLAYAIVEKPLLLCLGRRSH